MSGGLDVCILPPSTVSVLIIIAGTILLACSVASSVLAWQTRFGAAAAFAVPGALGFLLALIALVSSQSATSQPPSPPPGYSWYVAGGYVALAALVLLGVGFVIQLLRYGRKLRS